MEPTNRMLALTLALFLDARPVGLALRGAVPLPEGEGAWRLAVHGFPHSPRHSGSAIMDRNEEE